MSASSEWLRDFQEARERLRVAHEQDEERVGIVDDGGDPGAEPSGWTELLAATCARIEGGGLSYEEALEVFGPIFGRAGEFGLDFRQAAQEIRDWLRARYPGETNWARSASVEELQRFGLGVASEKWPELDPAALHGLAGEIVNAVDSHTEAHPAAVLIHLLGMFGSAVGRSPYVRASGGSHHHANVFVLVVGPTATGKKGTSAEYPKQIVARADGGWRCKGPGLSTGEGLIAGVADLTHEEIKDGVPKRDSRAFWLETEFGRTLRVSKREANTLFPVIQQLWDGGSAEVGTRKTPLMATDAHVSIFGHVAPDVLRERLDALNAAEGFANRFLFCWSHQSKSLPDDEGLDEQTLRSFVSRIAAALDVGHTCGELKKDPEAQALWREAYDELRRERPGLLGELTHRAAPQVLRVALIYALMDGAKAIRREHLEAALGVWKFSLDSARFIFGTKTGNLIADRIHAECRAVFPDALTEEDIYALFHGHVTGLQLEIAAQLLANAGLAVRTPGKGLGRGKGRSPATWKATQP